MKGGARIREATRLDARAIAEVHVASWRSGYQGILPDEILDSLSVEERERTWREILEGKRARAGGRAAGGGFTLVAEVEGRIRGFCSVATPSPDPDLTSDVAEIGALYVAPKLWRQGIGTALLVRAMKEVHDRDHQRATLWTLAGHEHALGFYSRLGFAPDGAERSREQTGGRREIRLACALPRRAQPAHPVG
jgi:GNAT superfamily N-acetyltransferase